LLADLCRLSELAEAGAFRGNALEHPCLRYREVMPVLAERGQHGRLHEAIRDEQEKAQVQLTVVIGHVSMVTEVRTSD
jgi:hypothetical protein